MNAVAAPAATASAGWEARLALHYAQNGGRTVVRSRHSGPLRVQKALYPEGGVCHSVLLHPPGGIAGGDHLSIEMDVGAGAQALATTPGAAKWYKSNGRPSTQAVALRVAAGAALEWLPQENILFDRCECRITTRIDLDPGARYLGWEILCLGRAASGERFDQGSLMLDTRLCVGGTPLWLERGTLRGGSALMASPLAMAGRTVCATLVATGHAFSPEVLDACRAEPAGGGLSGVTVMDGVLVARWLGDASEAARGWCEGVWRCVRPGLFGREACRPRIWNT